MTRNMNVCSAKVMILNDTSESDKAYYNAGITADNTIWQIKIFSDDKKSLIKNRSYMFKRIKFTRDSIIVNNQSKVLLTIVLVYLTHVFGYIYNILLQI